MAFASTRMAPSGTGTSRTSVACAFAKAVRFYRLSSSTAAALLACSGRGQENVVHGGAGVGWHGEYSRGGTNRPCAECPSVRTGRRLALATMFLASASHNAKPTLEDHLQCILES